MFARLRPLVLALLSASVVLGLPAGPALRAAEAPAERVRQALLDAGHRAYFLGLWRLEVPMTDADGTIVSVLRYEEDGRVSGAILFNVRNSAGRRRVVPISGTWSVQAIDEHRGRITVRRDDGAVFSAIVARVTADSAWNEQDGEMAQRIPVYADS